MIPHVHPLPLETLQGKIRCHLGLGIGLEDRLPRSVFNPRQPEKTSASQSYHQHLSPCFPHLLRVLLSDYLIDHVVRPTHSFRVDDFLHINIIIKVRAVGCIVAGAALVFFRIFQVLPRVGMALGGPVAGFTLDVLKSGARFSLEPPTPVVWQAKQDASEVLFLATNVW